MKLALLLALVASTPALFGQGSVFSEEEVIHLTPFEVTMGSSSPGSYDPRYRGQSSPTTPVYLTRKADCVMLRLTISSDAKRPEERITELQAAHRKLQEAAKANGQVLCRIGYLELPLVARKILSDATSEQVSSFDVTLIAKLSGPQTVFERTSFLNSFVDGLDLGRSVKARFVSTGIGLLETEALRAELIKLVSQDAELMRKSFGQGTVLEIRGLDQRVQVRRISDTELQLFLPYGMTVRTGEAP
jgi:hypothetical protein